VSAPSTRGRPGPSFAVRLRLVAHVGGERGAGRLGRAHRRRHGVEIVVYGEREQVARALPPDGVVRVLGRPAATWRRARPTAPTRPPPPPRRRPGRWVPTQRAPA
jgi:hypothetical protein